MKRSFLALMVLFGLFSCVVEGEEEPQNLTPKTNGVPKGELNQGLFIESDASMNFIIYDQWDDLNKYDFTVYQEATTFFKSEVNNRIESVRDASSAGFELAEGEYLIHIATSNYQSPIIFSVKEFKVEKDKVVELSFSVEGAGETEDSSIYKSWD